MAVTAPGAQATSGNKDHSPALPVSGDKQGAVTGKSVNHTAQQEAGQAMGRGRGRSSALKEVGELQCEAGSSS